MLSFQWQLVCRRVDRRHQRHVSRLRHPFPSQSTARFASLVDFFFSRTPIFFSLFSQCGAWSQASSRLQDSWDSSSRKVVMKPLGTRGETRKGSLYQLLVYPVIDQFRLFTSTLTLITWVHVCRVKPTWWVWKKKKKKTWWVWYSWYSFNIYNKESLTFWHEWRDWGI